MDNKALKKLEADLWDAADNLRANSKVDYYRRYQEIIEAYNQEQDRQAGDEGGC